MATAVAGAARSRDPRYLWGAALTLGLALLVVLHEVDVLSDQVVAPDTGYSWSLGTLFGPDLAAGSRGWGELISQHVLAGRRSVYGRLLLAHLLVDLLFIAVYAPVLAWLGQRAFTSRPGKVSVRAAVVVLVVCDVAEDALAAGLIAGSHPASSWLTVATGSKWACTAVIAAVILVRALVPRRGRRRPAFGAPLRRAGRALLHHRFSVALVVPLLALTVLWGHPLLDQLPDAQRAWVSPGDGSGGLGHAAAAALAIGLVASLSEVFGRYRTGYARRHTTGGPRPPGAVPTAPPAGWRKAWWLRVRGDVGWLATIPLDAVARRSRLRTKIQQLRSQERSMLALWLVGPALALVGAASAAAGRSTAPVLVVRLAVFCGVSLLVAVASWLLHRLWQVCPGWQRPDRPPRFYRRDVSAIAFTGHALALSLLTVAGLGLLRSFTSMVLLVRSAATRDWLLLAFWFGGFVLAVLPWLATWRVSETVGQTDRNTATRRFDRKPGPAWPRWLLLAGVIAGIVVLASRPVWFGSRLGVSATAIVSISLVVSLPATAGLLVQDRPTAEVFRLFGFRRTPLITVLVLTIALIGFTSGQGSINEVDRGDGKPAPVDFRPPFANGVEAWSRDARACSITVGGREVRPMLLVAAEGGGIRAAYWTVLALDRLVQQSPPFGDNPSHLRDHCAAHSTLISGGASGGSVGLAVARFSGTPDDPGTDRAVAAVQRMAEPDTLAAAVVGTFLRDPLYGATGVPVRGDSGVPVGEWTDRARLIELGWAGAIAGPETESRTAQNGSSFLADRTVLSPATGQLVLNSSSVLNKCRVWISQVRFPMDSDAGRGRGEQGCGQAAGPGPRTIDLFSAYGPFGPAPAERAGCLGQIGVTTAALLTARFPYVTPGGVVGDCPVPAGSVDNATGYWARTQLVDGGYLENTGLATITDLAPDWTAQVRRHNEEALTSGAPLIAPIIVFLPNGSGDVVRPAGERRPKSELLVPPATGLGGKASLVRTDALLARANAAVSTDAFCPSRSGTAALCAQISARLPRRVIVVDRASQPEVSAPLGWTLSAASRASLDRAMDRQQATYCVPHDGKPVTRALVCDRGYGALGDLLAYVERGPSRPPR